MTKTLRKLRRQSGGMKALVPERRCDHYVGYGGMLSGWRLIRKSERERPPGNDRWLHFAYCPLCGEKLPEVKH